MFGAKIINKLIEGFFGDEEPDDAAEQQQSHKPGRSRKVTDINERRSRLKVHMQTPLKINVIYPKTFDEASQLADCLLANTAVVVNFEQTNVVLQQRITDFLNGVSYSINARAERISNYIYLYVPSYVDIAKDSGSYSVPLADKRHEGM